MTTKHIIKKQTLDITLDSNENSFALQNEISRIFYSEIVPIIDKCLTALDNSNEAFRIDKLEIDAGVIDPRNIRYDLIQSISKQLPQKISEILQKKEFYEKQYETANESIPKENKEFEILKYYIQNGRLPWWIRSGEYYSVVEIMKTYLTAKPAIIKVMLAEFVNNQNIIKRIALTFNDEILENIINLFQKEQTVNVINIINELNNAFVKSDLLKINNKLKLKKEIWQQVVLQSVLDKKINFQILIEKVIKHISQIYNTKSEELYNYFVKEVNNSTYNLKEEPVNLKEKDGLTKTNITQELKLILKQILKSDAITNNIPVSLKKIIEKINNNLEKQLSLSLEDLENMYVEFKSIIDTEKIKNDKTIIEKLLKTIEKVKKQQKENELNQLLRKENTFTDSDEIYLNNSGIVIFWPYLSSFFKSLGLTENNQFIDQEKQERAVCLLQYLVTANQDFLEYDIMLNKILCGIDLETPLDLNIELTENEIQESENLLIAVIKNWAVLKETTSAGLRSMFLTREGMISKRDGNWLLRIDEKAQDVLIGKMPWSIATIKLPWMKNLLFVEWGL